MKEYLKWRRLNVQDNKWLEQLGIQPNLVIANEEEFRMEDYRKLCLLLDVLPKMSRRVYQVALQVLRKY